MKTTSVTLTEELYRKAMEKAAQSGIYQFSALVRNLLTKYTSTRDDQGGIE